MSLNNLLVIKQKNSLFPLSLNNKKRQYILVQNGKVINNKNPIKFIL